MRSRLIVLLGFLLALALVVPLSAYALPAPPEVDVTVKIDSFFDLLVVDPFFTPLTDMEWTPTATDFNLTDNPQIKYPGGTAYTYYGGWTSDGVGATCLIKANSPWKVYLKGGAAFFSGGDGTKPVSDIVWIDGGQPYRHLTTTNESVYATAHSPGSYLKSGGGYNYSLIVPLTFRILLDWTKDKKGTYTNTVIFTLAS